MYFYFCINFPLSFLPSYLESYHTHIIFQTQLFEMKLFISDTSMSSFQLWPQLLIVTACISTSTEVKVDWKSYPITRFSPRSFLQVCYFKEHSNADFFRQMWAHSLCSLNRPEAIWQRLMWRRAWANKPCWETGWITPARCCTNMATQLLSRRG